MTRYQQRQPPHTRQAGFPRLPNVQNRLDTAQTELEAVNHPLLPSLDERILDVLDELKAEMDAIEPKSAPNRRLRLIPGGETDYEDENSPLILFHLNEKTGEWEREVLRSPFRSKIRQKLRQKETMEAMIRFLKKPFVQLRILFNVLIGREDPADRPTAKPPVVRHFYGRTARGEKLHIMVGSATRSTFICGAAPGGRVSASIVPTVEGDICKNCLFFVKRGEK